MRRLLISTVMSLVWVIPALAQDAPESQATAPNAAQDQDNTLNQDPQSIQRSVQASLAQAGFTDIQMVPTSFLVRAKDPDGNPVVIALSPESIAELKGIVPGQGSEQSQGPSSNEPRRQPSTTAPGSADTK